MNSKDARRVLVTTGWLAERPAVFRDALLDAGRLQAVAAGELFSIAGGAGEGMWGIVAGQVTITSGMNSAEAPISLLFNPGNWIGYAPLFGFPLRANARAAVDSIVLRVPFSDIRRLLAANPGWWEHFGRLTLENSMVFAIVAVDLLLTPPERRVAAILLHQAGCRTSGTRPSPIHLSQAEIGEMATLSRHPARRILHDFEARGWIEHGYRCIHVRAPEPMRRLADGG